MKRTGLAGLLVSVVVAAAATACGGSSNGAKVVSSDGDNGPKAIGEEAFEIGKAALSPDGTRLVELTGDADELHLNVIDTASGATVFHFADSSQRAGEGPVDWAWAPDGESIAALRTAMPGPRTAGAAELLIVPAQGGTERVLTTFRLDSGRAGGAVAWAPDAKSLAVLTQRDGDLDLALVDAASGVITWLTQDALHEGDIEWSPDGRRIALTAFPEGASPGSLRVIGLDGKTVTTFAIKLLGPSFLDWSPDGSSLAVCGIPDPQVIRGVTLFRLDPVTGATTKAYNTTCNSAPAWSPDGGTIAVTEQTAVKLVDVATGKETELKHMDGKELRSPNWSRDGKSIYFVTRPAYRD